MSGGCVQRMFRGKRILQMSLDIESGTQGASWATALCRSCSVCTVRKASHGDFSWDRWHGAEATHRQGIWCRRRLGGDSINSVACQNSATLF